MKMSKAIGIIGAMKVEVDGLCALLEGSKKEEYGSRTFYVGKIKGIDVVIVESGVGKVNASITTTLLCEKYDISLIINTGVAGGVGNVKPLDLVISDKLMYHDFDLSPIGYKKGELPSLGKIFETDNLYRTMAIEVAEKENINYKVGNIASGDIFATNTKILDGLDMEISAVEMEGAAIAHASKIFNKPFIALRVISDVLGTKNQAISFNLVEKKAAEYAILFVLKIIDKMVLTK